MTSPQRRKPTSRRLGRLFPANRLFASQPARVKVLVTPLAGDAADLGQTRRLAAALGEQDGVDVITIAAAGAGGPPDAPPTREAEQQRRNWLAEHDGDVLIWGAVLPAAHRLRLCFLGRYEGTEGRHGVYQLRPVELPKHFGPDLEGQLLALVALTGALAETRSRATLPQLVRPAVTKLTRLLEHPPRHLAAEQQAALWHALALAATLHGEHSGNQRWLDMAIHAYRAALQSWTVDDAPLEWAMVHNNLGSTLMVSTTHHAEGPASRGQLDQAIEAFRQALEVYRRRGVSSLASHTEANLARAEVLLTERRSAAE